jgi:hypothetical protein
MLHKPELAVTRNGGKHRLPDHINDNLSLQSWTVNDIERAWIVTKPSRADVSRSESGNRTLQPAPNLVQYFADQLLDEERKRLGLQSASLELPAGGDIAPSQALLYKLGCVVVICPEMQTRGYIPLGLFPLQSPKVLQ